MTSRRPLFTIISLLSAVLFAVGSRPILSDSIAHQLADASLNSSDAVEASGQMAGLALIAGQLLCAGIGAAMGVVLASVGFLRRERWEGLRWGSLILNLATAALVGFSLFPLWRS